MVRAIAALVSSPARVLLMFGVWATVALAAMPGSAAAQAGLLGARIETCIAPMRPAQSAARLFAAPHDFDCTRKQATLGSGDFDLISKRLPPDIAQSRDLVMRFSSVWMHDVTLYVKYADGRIARIALDQHGLSRHIQLGAIVAIPLPPHRASPTAILWRVHGASNSRGVVLGPRITTRGDGARTNLILAALYAAFAGLCLALVVHNLALWGALRHRFQLAYCAMVVTLGLYGFSSSGTLAWVWPGIANNDRIRINYVLLALAMTAALCFARSFFEERVFAGWLGKLTTAASATVLVAAIAFTLFAPVAPRLFDRFYAAAIILTLAAVIPILVRAYRRKSDYLWLFAIGWAAPIGFAALRVANNLHLVRYSFWVDQSTVIAMTLETLFSSLAIAYRMHLLSRERDEAREQEIAARMLAATDPLTGLLNRRAFLEQAVGRAEEQLLILADIDHFKRVNETIGHDGGDEVLRLFARALRAAVPDEAVIARMGGEEFAVLAPASSSLSAMRVLEILRAQRMPFDLTVTASIGACIGPITTEVDWKRLYRQADLALFEAKAAGRDRARHARIDAAA